MNEFNFKKLLKRDETHPKDRERLAMFYIFANNQDLYSKVDVLYDFELQQIKLDYAEQADFCTSSQRLVQLAFNLYNGNGPADVLETFCYLDKQNFEVAMEAIRIRFDKPAD